MTKLVVIRQRNHFVCHL